jgi:hypothetical protein
MFASVYQMSEYYYERNILFLTQKCDIAYRRGEYVCKREKYINSEKEDI